MRYGKCLGYQRTLSFYCLERCWSRRKTQRVSILPQNLSTVPIRNTFFSTPFGLYRDGTELRAVYYSKPDAARAACLSMGDQCDFPILMGTLSVIVDIRGAEAWLRERSSIRRYVVPIRCFHKELLNNCLRPWWRIYVSSFVLRFDYWG